MAKGTTISLPLNSSNVSVVEAVYKEYADKIRSPKGWYGAATVTLGDKNSDKCKTLIVKAVAGGFDIYKKTSHVPVTLTPTIGTPAES